MSTVVRNVPLPKGASAGDDPSVDARIASIIAGRSSMWSRNGGMWILNTFSR